MTGKYKMTVQTSSIYIHHYIFSLLFVLFFFITVHIYLNNIKYKVQDYDFFVIYVTITDGHVKIFQIRLQTLLKLVCQAKYPSI
jgi:hypothetical protein